MSKFYDPVTGGFWSKGRKTIPKTAKKITLKRFKSLMAAQAEGQRIVPGEDGYPVAEPNPVTLDDIRAERNLRLKQSDWTQLPDAPVDSQAWADYRRQLRDLMDGLTDPAEVVWPDRPN